MHPLRAEVDTALAADPRVVGWALVGSHGRGEADRWSDLDVLVALADDAWDDDVPPDVWPPAEAVLDGRRNVRVGGHALMTAHLRDGLPAIVDWYLRPASTIAWPSDCLVVADGGVARVDEPFSAWNDRGERRTPLPPTDASRALFRLRMALVVATRVARGDDAEARRILSWLEAEDADALVVGDTPLAHAARRFVEEVDEVRGRGGRRG